MSPSRSPSPIPRYTVVGSPFSTFTRTITLALHYKSIPHAQVPALPHSPGADAAHPFGYIPTLLIHPGGSSTGPTQAGGNEDANANATENAKEYETENEHENVIKLRETQAIIRYIDRIVPEPTLHYRPPSPGQAPAGDSDPELEPLLEEKMWEFVSFVSSYGFQIIEHGFVKPRLAHQAAGLSPSEINDKLALNIPAFKHLLSTLTSILPRSSFPLPSHPLPPPPSTNPPPPLHPALLPTRSPKFLFGPHPTYADFHLFPILADLRVHPEWAFLLALNSGSRFAEWMHNMDALECVKKTREGTLGAQEDAVRPG